MRALQVPPFVSRASFSYRNQMLQHQAESLFPVQKGSSMTLKQENMRSAGLDEAVRLFGEAWAGGDIAKLEELLSPSYTHIDYFGNFTIGRVGWIMRVGAQGLGPASHSATCAPEFSVMLQLSLVPMTSIILATQERAMKVGAFDSRRFGCGRKGAGCGRHSKPQRSPKTALLSSDPGKRFCEGK